MMLVGRAVRSVTTQACNVAKNRNNPASLEINGQVSHSPIHNQAMQTVLERIDVGGHKIYSGPITGLFRMPEILRMAGKPGNHVTTALSQPGGSEHAPATPTSVDIDELRQRPVALDGPTQKIQAGFYNAVLGNSSPYAPLHITP